MISLVFIQELFFYHLSEFWFVCWRYPFNLIPTSRLVLNLFSIKSLKLEEQHRDLHLNPF